MAIKKAARRACTAPGSPNIDEGWTRWILENYGFAPVTLRNGDIQAGNLRERFDAIIIPDASARSISDGFATRLVPGEYAGGIGEAGTMALREFVRGGRHADRIQQRFACSRSKLSACR